MIVHSIQGMRVCGIKSLSLHFIQSSNYFHLLLYKKWVKRVFNSKSVVVVVRVVDSLKEVSVVAVG